MASWLAAVVLACLLRESTCYTLGGSYRQSIESSKSYFWEPDTDWWSYEPTTPEPTTPEPTTPEPTTPEPTTPEPTTPEPTTTEPTTTEFNKPWLSSNTTTKSIKPNRKKPTKHWSSTETSTLSTTTSTEPPEPLLCTEPDLYQVKVTWVMVGVGGSLLVVGLVVAALLVHARTRGKYCFKRQERQRAIRMSAIYDDVADLRDTPRQNNNVVGERPTSAIYEEIGEVEPAYLEPIRRQ